MKRRLGWLLVGLICACLGLVVGCAPPQDENIMGAGMAAMNCALLDIAHAPNKPDGAQKIMWASRSSAS